MKKREIALQVMTNVFVPVVAMMLIITLPFTTAGLI